jgi:nucleotide-binding universal stress UspA family protein
MVVRTTIAESEPPTKAIRGARPPGIPRALQIKTILVPLDFSRASMQAFKYAIRLAEEFKGTIHLVHVQPTDELTAISRAGGLMLNCADAIALMQDRLDEVQSEKDQFQPDNCHVVSGRAFEQICKLASEIEADLIILPTRGHGRLRHVILGSTAERVVRYAPCPVLIPRGARFKSITWSGGADGTTGLRPRKILVPVDFSACSLAGVRYAARLAKDTGATLRLFHAVFPYAQVFAMDRVGADITPLTKNAMAMARAEMSELLGMSFLRGVRCETEIRTGPAIDQICGETKRDDIDLAVTSTHGRTGFKRAVIGSVAEHVVRYAECPVIIVPSRGRS